MAADKRNSFAIEEKRFLGAIDAGAWGTFHVHPNPWDEDGPSLADKDRSNAWNLPMCIFVRRKMHFKYWLPDGLPTPLARRPYVPSILDCYALVRDALKQYVSFEIPEFDRDRLDFKGHLPGHENFWGPLGWELLLQPKPGRVAMIDFGGHGKVNHLGLLISGHEMLHQVRGQLSRLDYFGSWVRWTLGYLAHPAIEVQALQRLPVNPFDFGALAQPATMPINAPGSPPDAPRRVPKVNIAGGRLERPQRPPLRHPLRGLL